MIIFVGDKPSKKNIDPDVAFVGTVSYRRLLEWIYLMNLSINDVNICNKDDSTWEFWERISATCTNINFVALGRNAANFLHKKGVEHFTLPHPSGLNRSINDKSHLNRQLELCKQWIRERE